MHNLIKLFSALILVLTASGAALAQNYRPVQDGEMESAIKKLPKEFHLIQSYLSDSQTGWKLHKGDLRMDHSFNNTDALIVDGNLTIEGNYDDYTDGIGMLVVLGDMRADNIISWGSLAVSGKLIVPGLIYAYYNDFTFEVGEAVARALVVYDKSTFMAKNSAILFLSSDNPQDEAEVDRILRTFVPEVMIPHIKDMDGDLSYIFPDFDACKKILANNKSVFREKEGAPELLKDVTSLLSPDIAAETIPSLIQKDRLLQLVSLLRDDLSPSIQDRFFAEGDPVVLQLLGERPALSRNILEKFVASKDPETRAKVLNQKELPRDLAIALSKDSSSDIRLGVIQRGFLGKLDPSETERLLNDSSSEVRAAVVAYQGTSLSHPQAIRLSEDKDSKVRTALAQYLAYEALWRRYPTLTSKERENIAARLLNTPETSTIVLPALPAEEQEKLIAGLSEAERGRVLYELASSTSSVKLQQQIAVGEMLDVKQELAGNVSISSAVQLQLFNQLKPAASRKRLSMFDSDATSEAMDGPEGVIDKLLQNPNATSEIITRAARYCADTRGNAVFCSALTHRKDLSPEVLDILKKAYSGEEAEDLGLTTLLQPKARRDQVVWGISRWYDDEPKLLDELASLKGTNDAGFWSGLARAKSEKLRGIAAVNANTPPESLAELLTDEVEDVKLAASGNPSLSKPLLEAFPKEAPLWSTSNPNISEEKLKAIHDWAIDRGEINLASHCLEQLAARRLRTDGR